MAEEEVVGATSPAPTDHKRKLEDLEPDAPEPPTTLNSNGSSDSAATDLNGAPSDDSDAKRPRLDAKSDDLVDAENGYEEEKTDEPSEEVTEQSAVVNKTETEDAEPKSEDAQETGNNEEPTTDDIPTEAARQLSESENALGSAAEGEVQEPVEELQVNPADASQQGDDSSREEQPTSSDKVTSRKMEVPSNKVGVLIGKAGDTIRTLQNHSGARIQITRDSDADPSSTTRPVELIGSLESIIKAEKLIKDVIAEADAGGSPSLVARGFSSSQSSGATEQIQIQVPNEKVGLIIGKGGETIKNLQTRSGARIQLIPQHLPEGDQSKERTVRVTGDKKQIEMAREMIKEAMNQPVRSSSSGAYNQQQGFRPRGPAVAQWGPRGPHPGQQAGYDYQQRGPYASQNNQYPAPAYGNYPQPPRSDFGWEQRPPTTAQVPPAQTGYDYYGGQGGHTATPSAQLLNPMHTHAPGPGMGPPTQAGYNYGQPQAPNYGQPAPYSQTAPPLGYGHGYSETKYENQGPALHPYGGHGSQASNYPQGTHPAYAQQEQYGKPPSYNMPQQGPYPQPYAQPRASQPGDAPYQGPVSATQPYGPNAAAQQPYPYASSGQMQQAYPQYGSAPSNDGYNQPTSAPVYPQQGGQPVAGYAQTGGQPVAGYTQAGPTAGYAQYPASQPGFTEQAAAQNNAGYGYQGVQDPAYVAAAAAAGSAYGAPPSGQPAYSQPAPTQPGFDQSVPQSGGYANVPVAYGKSVSPQPGYPPQYDASQMYAGHR